MNEQYGKKTVQYVCVNEQCQKHEMSGTAVTGGAAQAISSVSVVAIAATGVAVIGVL